MSSANDDLLQILKDALEREGFVRGGHMFGGVGVYFDGTFFAIITGGTIYLKTSEGMRARFEAEWLAFPELGHVGFYVERRDEASAPNAGLSSPSSRPQVRG